MEKIEEDEGWFVGNLWSRSAKEIDKKKVVLYLGEKDLDTRAGFRSVLSWVYRVGLYNSGDKLNIMRGVRPFDLIRRWAKDETTDDDRLELEDAAIKIADGELE